ncbi:ribonuclease 3-like protein 3 [Carica papaya]|uniref:ribonuclease 3-like protein 3 n=1 Tax=Carica papaya TaxID=3649 RepID=UPI000B8C9294|nr:ribonuclease 3-like protein 3 [Carica papaya]
MVIQQVEELDITVGRSKVDREDNAISESATTESNQTEPPASLDEVEEILNYRFRNKRLLEEAFTPGSYPKRDRFVQAIRVYVGDSVLNLIVTREQYSDYPDLSPGALTRLRAANVDTEKLARVAIKHELHRFLRHKKPLLGEQVSGYV